MSCVRRRAFLFGGTSALLHSLSAAEVPADKDRGEPLLWMLGNSGWDLRKLAYSSVDELEAAVQGERISIIWDTGERKRWQLPVPGDPLEQLLLGLHAEHVRAMNWGVRAIQRNAVTQGWIAVKSPELRVEITPVLKGIKLYAGDCIAIGPLNGWKPF